MNRPLAVVGIVVVVAGAAGGAFIAGRDTAPHSPIAAVVAAPITVRSAGRLPAVPSCTVGNPVMRPRAITLSACGGSQPSYVSGVTWHAWTGKLAVGVGTFHRRVCTPDCAQGVELSFPAAVVLSHPIRRVFACVTIDSPTSETATEMLRTASRTRLSDTYTIQTTCTPATGRTTAVRERGWGTYGVGSGQ